MHIYTSWPWFRYRCVYVLCICVSRVEVTYLSTVTWSQLRLPLTWPWVFPPTPLMMGPCPAVRVSPPPTAAEMPTLKRREGRPFLTEHQQVRSSLSYLYIHAFFSLLPVYTCVLLSLTCTYVLLSLTCTCVLLCLTCTCVLLCLTCIYMYVLLCLTCTYVFSSGNVHASDCGSTHCSGCVVNGISAKTAC